MEMRKGWEENDRGKRWKRIASSRYNKWYRMIKGSEVPEYLRSFKKEGRLNRVIRFRMGEGMSECRYWLNESEKLCRVCSFELENWEQIFCLKYIF